jgi:hypothetical protein
MRFRRKKLSAIFMKRVQYRKGGIKVGEIFGDDEDQIFNDARLSF